MSIFYKSAIARDLPRWRKNGWVSETGAAAILADVEARTPKITIGGVFGLIAAALLCLALAAFIAANWDAIGRATKLGLIVGLLWLAYGVSIGAHIARWPMVAHAALLIASSGFGGGIMLISQIYHLSGHPPDAVLMWALGALAGGALLNSKPTLALAALLLAIWGEMEIWTNWPAGADAVWLTFVLWGVLSLAYIRADWRGGFHFVAIALCWQIILLSFRFDADAARNPVFGPSLTIALAALALGAAATMAPRIDALLAGRARALTVYAFITAFATLLLWRIDGTSGAKGLEAMAPSAIVILGFVLTTLLWAIAVTHSTLSWWCYAALTGELTYLYFRTLGTLLETAIFFLVTALVVIIVAIAAARLQRRLAQRREAST